MMATTHELLLEKGKVKMIQDLRDWNWLDTEKFIIEIKQLGYKVTMRVIQEEEV